MLLQLPLRYQTYPDRIEYHVIGVEPGLTKLIVSYVPNWLKERSVGALPSIFSHIDIPHETETCMIPSLRFVNSTIMQNNNFGQLSNSVHWRDSTPYHSNSKYWLPSLVIQELQKLSGKKTLRIPPIYSKQYVTLAVSLSSVSSGSIECQNESVLSLP